MNQNQTENKYGDLTPEETLERVYDRIFDRMEYGSQEVGYNGQWSHMDARCIFMANPDYGLELAKTIVEEWEEGWALTYSHTLGRYVSRRGLLRTVYEVLAYRGGELRKELKQKGLEILKFYLETGKDQDLKDRVQEYLMDLKYGEIQRAPIRVSSFFSS